jgi:methionyl-tRNA formyltransferase
MRAGVSLERGTPISFDLMEKGAVLFLTNNSNTDSLYKWLCEKEEKVYKIQNKLTLEMVQQLKPSFIVSFNYRHIISKEVLEAMPGRVINLHTSYLPYNRGSSPNFFSFLDNTKKGVTIHLMDEKLDTGDILCQKELFFDEEQETFESSYYKLIEEITSLFRENWDNIKLRRILPKKQEGEGTCHRMRELDAFRGAHPFAWSGKIADVKRRCEV